ncbi:MAG: SOS response-associated peptidase family protein [Stellaceae bacterium]
MAPAVAQTVIDRQGRNGAGASPAIRCRRCARRDDGAELVQLRWGFPPARPKGAPVINFRSEGRRFPVGRCLIPASHFYEFTGRRSPKSKWQFTKLGEDCFCFAGLWRPMPDGDAFTLLTTEPAPTWRRSTIGRWWSSIAPTGSLGSILNASRMAQRTGSRPGRYLPARSQSNKSADPRR